MELGIGDVNGELLKNVTLFGIKVETKLTLPFKTLVTVNSIANEVSRNGPEMRIIDKNALPALIFYVNSMLAYLLWTYS